MFRFPPYAGKGYTKVYIYPVISMSPILRLTSSIFPFSSMLFRPGTVHHENVLHITIC